MIYPLVPSSVSLLLGNSMGGSNRKTSFHIVSILWMAGFIELYSIELGVQLKVRISLWYRWIILFLMFLFVLSHIFWQKGGGIILIFYNHWKVVSHLWVTDGGGGISAVICLMLSICSIFDLWVVFMCLVRAFFFVKRPVVHRWHLYKFRLFQVSSGIELILFGCSIIIWYFSMFVDS